MVRIYQFYIVPTPIGNLKDITLQSLEVLKTVDYIACEDTRTTQKLLNHYGIKTKCISYHKFNERERIQYFLDLLNDGKTIALVSDAGTPHICDPGNEIIKALIDNNISFTSLPGACAITTFLSRLPRRVEEFTFIGFIPKNKTMIKELLRKFRDTNVVFYDSPERILKTLKIIQEEIGNTQIALGRELSKLFEEVDIDNIVNITEKYKDGIKGEIVCMIYTQEANEKIDILNKVNLLSQQGFKAKEISIILSTLYKCNKNEIYKRILENKS